MPSLDIRKGDKKNLKGSVAIYAAYSPPKNRNDHADLSPGNFYAMFFSLDLETAIDHTNLSDESIDDILIKAHRPQDYVNGENYDGQRYSCYVLVADPFNSEKELFKKFQNWHIVFSGNVSAPKRLFESLLVDAERYFNKYFNRLKRERTMLKKKGLGFYITKKYINPLIKANTLGMSRRFNELRTQFYNFAEREKLPGTDVTELFAIIESGHPNPELINAYVLKIEAIATEKYEQAAEMNGKIDGMVALNRTDVKRV